MHTEEKTFGLLKVALNYDFPNDDVSMSSTFTYEHEGFSSMLTIAIDEHFPSQLYGSSTYNPELSSTYVIHHDTHSIIGCKNDEMLSRITISKQHMDEFIDWFSDVIVKIADRYANN